MAQATIAAPSSGAQRSAPVRIATGFPLGRPFGIAVTADASLLLIFGLLVINLGAFALPSWHPNWSPLLVWVLAAIAALSFLASVLLHELSHALVGRAFNIEIRGITLFMFGGVAHLEDEPKSPRAEFLMAAAGPLMSLLIGSASTLLGLWIGRDAFARFPDPKAAQNLLGPLPTLLLWLGPFNVFLAIFNLVPGFPLDGGRVLRAVLWWVTGDLRGATRWATMLGQGLVLGRTWRADDSRRSCPVSGNRFVPGPVAHIDRMVLE
jgi:Zn-dependent protease